MTFKKAGDGFLVDALCADGYTYAWYFRNQLAPKCWTYKELSPMHARVMVLVGQLTDSNYKFGMDKLLMSSKFSKIAKNDGENGIMIHGVCRVSPGDQDCIHQVVVTKKRRTAMKQRYGKGICAKRRQQVQWYCSGIVL